MCKIAVIQNVKQGKEKEVMRLARALTPLMVANDNDGFGYMALGTNGLFGEKWLNTKQAWNERSTLTDLESEQYWGYYSDVMENTVPHESFGHHTEKFTSIALHARKATCGKSLQNVHPFIAQDGLSGVIHNGVISNTKDFKNTLSTCDSESILIAMKNHALAESLHHVSPLTKSLFGWYAFAAYSKKSDGQWVLDIVKDDSASLYAMLVPNLGTWVFVTDMNHLKTALKSLKWKSGAVFEVIGDRAIRTCAVTGTIIDVAQFESNNIADYWDNGHNYGSTYSPHFSYLDNKGYPSGVDGYESERAMYQTASDILASDDAPEEESEKDEGTLLDTFDHINMAAMRAARGKH